MVKAGRWRVTILYLPSSVLPPDTSATTAPAASTLSSIFSGRAGSSQRRVTGQNPPSWGRSQSSTAADLNTPPAVGWPSSLHRHKAVRGRSTAGGREVAVGRAAITAIGHQRARWPSRRHLKQRVRLLQAAARWSGEKQLKHRPRRSAGTRRRGPRSTSRRALRERRLSAFSQPSASGPRFGRGNRRTGVAGSLERHCEKDSPAGMKSPQVLQGSPPRAPP